MLGMIKNLSLRADQGGTAMAQRHQRGWLKKETRSNGETWVLFYRTIRKSDGKRVENKIAIGLVRDFPEKSHAWAEVERLHLAINQVNSRRGVTFGTIRWLSRTAVRWGPQFSSSAPPRSPAPPVDHFPFGPAILRRRVPSRTCAWVRQNFSPW